MPLSSFSASRWLRNWAAPNSINNNLGVFVSTNNFRRVGKGSLYLSLCVGAALSQSALAQTAAQSTTSTAANSDNLEELVITGYRKSLTDSTKFKKESLGFVDGTFAEDMGKFPDTNVAES